MIREVSYAVPDDGHGHLAEMRVDPIGLFERVRAECGDIGQCTMTCVFVRALQPARGRNAPDESPCEIGFPDLPSRPSRTRGRT